MIPAAARAVSLALLGTRRGDYVGSDIPFTPAPSMGEEMASAVIDRRVETVRPFAFPGHRMTGASERAECRMRSSRRDRETPTLKRSAAALRSDVSRARGKIVVEEKCIDQSREALGGTRAIYKLQLRAG
jgi:hypothetical protein